MRLRKTGILLLTAAAMLAAADNPFICKWKLNVAKSEFTGTTTTYEQTAAGQWQMTANDGQSYKFRMDGKEYPATNGAVAIWKQVDSHTWETSYKMNGVPASTGIRKLSSDGETMTAIFKWKKPNGESFENSTTEQRVAGGPGLAGKWKSTQVNISAPDMMEVTAAGDGLSMRIPAWNETFDVKFDGKDYHPAGPTVPAGYTMSMKKTGPRSFEVIDKMNGKVTDTATETISADGKTWTEVMTMAGSNEKTRAVFERQ